MEKPQLKMVFGKYVLDLKKTLIMGVLNITPDSFSDGGEFLNIGLAIKQAKKMVEEGADIIDIGGESSRPGSNPVFIKEELKRVLPVIKLLAKEIKVPISIDTYKPEVAEICLKAGASIVNDITGLRDKKMVELVAKTKCPVVIMHMKGSPKDMQKNPKYKDVVEDVAKFFKEKISMAKEAGIKNIILDPGIGFGKTVEDNLKLIKGLKIFLKFSCPIMVGSSRKSFIGKINKTDNPKNRVEGTIASICYSIINGASIVRVHDIKQCKKAVEIIDAIKNIK
ncbi:MAG: dihydropteroate synthase [Candidatus Staskawiczbacteria bacterium]|nr:dihydropteroate synthase [Candidatus Staskawiczbacteria bacterium]